MSEEDLSPGVLDSSPIERGERSREPEGLATQKNVHNHTTVMMRGGKGTTRNGISYRHPGDHIAVERERDGARSPLGVPVKPFVLLRYAAVLVAFVAVVALWALIEESMDWMAGDSFMSKVFVYVGTMTSCVVFLGLYSLVDKEHDPLGAMLGA
uniref:Uncharacterized protein n=1 Tax=Chromera velia CCMP2878 TaxID=1169474 RepID=A0A0G4HFA0_9ALVE|eukprot:Cvel_26977.t1-p1 / transcript=Cvel_26977.t1 / gene=Cvel_26977 / organism=Chromera_velia_CCMP2878 / gene_product=hypothetical protein / transcript_product=hypothetical protein / location=Cvel_scaffold3293:1754-3240(-) / protein_length=153 / sequence_SO=supercontig / SO=protein_coding / is_pseudo=false